MGESITSKKDVICDKYGDFVLGFFCSIITSDNGFCYHAIFKVRKFESLFHKINTCLQKTTTCITLLAEQRYLVIMKYAYFSILSVVFTVSFLCYFQQFQLLLVNKFWTNFCCIVLLYLWAQKTCLIFLKSYFKLELLIF